MKKIIVLLLVLVLVSPVAFSADKPKSNTGNNVVIVFYTGLTIWGLATGISTGLAYCYFTGALFGAKTLKAVAAKPEK